MSTRNPKEWTAIRDIVWRAQETLSLLHVCRVNRLLSHYYSPPPPVTQYPQSLGELCMDIGQDWAWSSGGNHIWYVYTNQWCPCWQRKLRLEITRRDIQELRTKMYHKHKDPAKERETARAERIINLIRFV